MHLVIATYNCRICCLDHVRTYADAKSVGEVICPECKMSSLSAVKNKEIVEAWRSFLRNQTAKLLPTVKEGGSYLRLRFQEEEFNLPDGQDFGVRVELAS